MTTYTFQPGAAAGIDTNILSTSATFNFGAYTFLMTGTTRKGLLKFDISTIPAVFVITSAVMYLYQVGSGAALAWTVTVYPILVGNAAWIAGTQNAALALAGEPCWNALAADGAGGVTTAWAGGAGMPTAGVDYGVALGTFSGNRSDANGTEYIFSIPIATAQTWISPINQNYGMLLVTSASTGSLASSNHAIAAYHPKLVVNGNLPGGGIFNSPLAAPFRGVFG